MKFATAKEHRDFFQKNGWIEFDEFLTNEQLVKANLAIEQVLSERLKVASERLRFLSPGNLYLQGHDLWRLNQILFKLATQLRFAEIVSELIEKKPLRLGYDQLLPAASSQVQKIDESQQIYSHFLDQTTNLEMISCIRGVVCGMVWNLGGNGKVISNFTISSESIDIFPKKKGNVTLFRPDALVNWHNLYKHPGQNFYMIVYTQATSYYFLQPSDPHTHALKRLGYVFNDKLRDNLHPIIYR